MRVVKGSSLSKCVTLPSLYRPHASLFAESAFISSGIIFLKERVTISFTVSVTPGGQSGNPGSKYYDSFVNDWAQGKYYKLHFAKKDDMVNKITLTGKMSFSK